MSSEYCIVVVTISSASEAKIMATHLLQERLVACVNLVPKITSLYWWQDKIEECREALTAETGARGAFYGVVLNAGITRDTAFPAMESKDWHDVIDVNLNAFYPGVRKGGDHHILRFR